MDFVRCNACQSVFSDERSLWIHILKEHTEEIKNLISVLCAITSATRLHATTKTHTSSILQCDLICETVFIAFLYHRMADLVLFLHGTLSGYSIIFGSGASGQQAWPLHTKIIPTNRLVPTNHQSSGQLQPAGVM